MFFVRKAGVKKAVVELHGSFRLVMKSKTYCSS